MINRVALVILTLASVVAGCLPASAQFYQNKTLTLLINFAVGGNADVEARVYQRYLSKHIPGHPSIIVQNAPGAGGLNAMNILGLDLQSKPDGLTAGYFTMNPIATILGDPGLKVSLADFVIIAGEQGWNVAYGRKDIPPGLKTPTDLAKAKNIFAGGYSKSSAIDTKIRLALDVLGVPYKVITGFPGTADINKAMLQGEVNFAVSSLPAFDTQVIPQIIKPGLGLPLFYFPVMGENGQVTTNPELEQQGIPAYETIYKSAFGKAPSDPKWNALLLVSTLNTELLRAVLLPKGSPPEAVAALREGFDGIAHDQEFLSEFQHVVGESPDIVSGQELQPLFERMNHVDPAVKKIIQDSING